MTPDVVTDPLDFIDPCLSVELLRRLQGGLEVRLGELHVERQQCPTLRERFDLAQVIAIYTEAVAKCRDVIKTKRRRAGWPEYQRPPGPSTRRSPSPLPRDPSGAMPRRASAGLVAGRLGVAGALPPPVMGHGWPASSRAGSAAAGPDRSGNALPLDLGDSPP